MRGRLTRRSALCGCGAVVATLAAALLAAPSPVLAEDFVSVRGAYYREASTRVVQPMLELSKDLPNGYEVGVHTMVDAISSASIAQGAATDEVFTEKRYEGSLLLARTTGLLRTSVFGRLSREPDYHSMTGGFALSREIWERTGTVAFSAAATHDDIIPTNMRAPKELDTWFAGLSYTQVLSPTIVAQASYEFFYLSGYMANAYNRSGNYGDDDVPDKRLRHALAIRAAEFLPGPTLGLQLSYRFYFDQGAIDSLDPWGMTAHTIEGRVFKNLTPNLEARLSYRFHWQGKALFWCNERPDFGGQTDCYGLDPDFHALDYKFGNYTTHLPEVKLTWDLRALTGLPVLGFFAAGALDISYGYYIENTPYGQKFDDVNAPPIIGDLPFTRSYGGAHLIQTGYSLPF